MKPAVAMLVSLALAGCATMTPQGERVRVVYNTLEVTACTSLGEVKAWDGFGGMMSGVGHENAERYMREEAAERGANVLLALYSRGGGTAGVSARGQAYLCPQRAGR